MSDDTIPVSKNIVSTVSNHLPDLTDDQVAAVLDTWNRLRTGDPVGTVRRDPDSGAVALRAEVEGIHLWRIVTPTGDQWSDIAATLAWPTVFEVTK